MKKVALSLMLMLALSLPAFASIQISQDGTNKGQYKKINLKNGITINDAGDVTFAAAAISGGTIDSSVIGGTTPAAGTFTTLASTGATTIGDAAADTIHFNANTIDFEGATADAFEQVIAFEDPTADATTTIPNSTGAVMVSSLTTNKVDVANSVTGTSNGVVYEGATADAFETTVSPVDPTADQTVSIPNFAVNWAYMGTTLTTNTIDAANSIWGVSNGLVFEGATADGSETTVSPVDPTADETWSIPNFAVNAAFLGSTLTTNNVDAANSVWGISNSLVFEGATADAFETTLTLGDPTADQTVTIPATAGATGTVDLRGATVVITAGTTPTLTVPLSVNFIATDTITTDNQDQTITFSSGGSVGQECTVVFQTDSGGTNDEVITFQTTLANTTGTLTLANLTANRYSIRFQSDGTVWNEVARTGAQT